MGSSLSFYKSENGGSKSYEICSNFISRCKTRAIRFQNLKCHHYALLRRWDTGRGLIIMVCFAEKKY